jgi:hypothetical protein
MEAHNIADFGFEILIVVPEEYSLLDCVTCIS